MNTVIIAVVVLAVLGAIFGLVLAIASKVFAVEVDPREEAIIGCLPLAFASGAGAGARCGMGVAVVGGMTFATLCGLLLIPAFYIISEKLARNFWKATGLKRIKFKYRMLRR